MTNPIIKIVNAETGEEIEREMNAQELAQLELDRAKAVAEEQVVVQAAAARAALLDKLGITEDEAKLLLGGN
jgi:hypothetical protein